MIRHICLASTLTFLPVAGGAQVVQCTTDSPERRGEPGCAIVADKRLPARLPTPVLWHIDEFRSLADAQRMETPLSLAIAAHGSAWLYSIDVDTANHHGGARAGRGAIVPEGDTMRMVATGTGPRRALVLILHDANKPGGFTLDTTPQMKSCNPESLLPTQG